MREAGAAADRIAVVVDNIDETVVDIGIAVVVAADNIADTLLLASLVVEVQEKQEFAPVSDPVPHSANLLAAHFRPAHLAEDEVLG